MACKQQLVNGKTKRNPELTSSFLKSVFLLGTQFLLVFLMIIYIIPGVLFLKIPHLID